MNDTQISSRQQKIMDILQKNPDGLNRIEIENILLDENVGVSKVTLLRDFSELIDLKLIKTTGVGKSTKYISNTHKLLSYIDVDEYFSKEIDERDISDSFSFEVFDDLENLFSKEELKKLDELNNKYRSNVKAISQDIYKKELERFVIDLSWKSSKIEGNTYTLLETEQLIKESIQAEGHSQAEAQMILNHKQAFDVISKNSDSFKKLDKKDIIDIHSVLVDKLNVTTGIRKYKVGITGTKYSPLGNQWQIEEAVEKLVVLINNAQHPIEKAFFCVVMLSYIQVFNDGNKRTARLVGNAMLMAFDFAPLSYRNVNELEYKKALLIFYEQNNLYYFKQIFIEQFEFVVNHYFESNII